MLRSWLGIWRQEEMPCISLGDPRKMPISGFGQSQKASSVGLLQRGDSRRKGQQVRKEGASLVETSQGSDAGRLGVGWSGLWDFGRALR